MASRTTTASALALKLDALPADILFSVRCAIHSDLATHVALSQTSKSLRALYRRADRFSFAGAPENEAEAEKFWRSACFLAGYGRPRQLPRSDGIEHKTPWRFAALQLAAHQRRCRVPECVAAGYWFGGVRSLYLPSASASPFTSPTPTPPLHWVSPTPPEKAITMHPLVHALHDLPASDSPDAGHAPDPMAILRTHLPSIASLRPDRREAQRVGLDVYGDASPSPSASAGVFPLVAHACAASVLATYPPVRTINLFVAPSAPGASYFPVKAAEPAECVRVRVHNPDGCTLLDVNRALAHALLVDPAIQAQLARVSLGTYIDLVLRLPGYPRTMVTREGVAALVRGLDAGFMGDHEWPYLYVLEEVVDTQ